MKKSHKWDEAVEAECPYCRVYLVYLNVGDEGDIVECHECNEQFQLGEPE